MSAYLLILAAFAADRLSKWWAAGYLAEKGTTEVHRLLTLRITYNSGIVFGMLKGIGPLIGWLTIVIIIGLLVTMARLPKSLTWQRVGLALTIGGALGNMVDRVIVGQVLDFIETPLRPGIFNLADVLIYAGVFLTLAGVLLERRAMEVDHS